MGREVAGHAVLPTHSGTPPLHPTPSLLPTAQHPDAHATADTGTIRDSEDIVATGHDQIQCSSYLFDSDADLELAVPLSALSNQALSCQVSVIIGGCTLFPPVGRFVRSQ